MLVVNPRRACAASVTVLGLCVCLCVCVSVCVCVCVCVCLHLFSPYRDQAGSSAIPTALAQQGLENLCGDVAKTVAFERYGVKTGDVDKATYLHGHYRFRLSGTLAVLRWRGASARTISRFQRARGVAVRWGAGRMLPS